MLTPSYGHVSGSARYGFQSVGILDDLKSPARITRLAHRLSLSLSHLPSMCITPHKRSFTLLCPTYQTATSSNSSARNKHSLDLFHLRTENANLHARILEYQAQLAVIEDKANTAQHLYYSEARKSVVLEREMQVMAMKICVLECFTRLVLESGMIDLDVDELLRYVEETWLANVEKNDIWTGDPPEPTPRHTIPDSYPTSQSLSEDSNPSQAEITPSPSISETRPYMPTFLHPLARLAEGSQPAPCNTATAQNTGTIGRGSSHRYFAQQPSVPVALSPDAKTRTVALTPEQLEALVSMERLVAAFSTDLGSLEVSSVESTSVYSVKSIAPSDCGVHVHDADATLVTPPSLTHLAGQSSPTAMTRKSAVPRTQIPRATTKVQGRSRLVSATSKTDAIKPPKTSRNTSSRDTSCRQSQLSKASTSRPKVLARTAKPSVPVQRHDLAKPSTPLMPNGSRNIRALRGNQNLSGEKMGRVKVQGGDAVSGRGQRWV